MGPQGPCSRDYYQPPAGIIYHCKRALWALLVVELITTCSGYLILNNIHHLQGWWE